MTVELPGISGLADIEAVGWPGDAPASTYEMIEGAARRDPSVPALSFFLSADAHRDCGDWTYRELLSEITLTANGLHSIGAGRDTVIACMLPNLPETHFV